MFNIGPQELLLILVLALMVVGPKRLPEIARSVGKGVRELRRAQDEVRKTIQVSLDEPAPPDRGRSGRRLPIEGRNEPAEPTASDQGPPADGASETAPAASGSDAAAPAAAAAGVTEVSRSLGRTLAELRRAREEVQRSFRVDLDAPAAQPRRTPRATARRATSSNDATTDGDPTVSDASASAGEPATPTSDDTAEAAQPDRPS
ncbi:MAG TPA: twin-arginine translocase TatA/TatE family subunit [Actinomycetota bacterium]|jgi:Tat protein translocase TatB subunit|nr:twin-arginine translocase TatA/TatE family subunit [Actinomycetota bacterium]